MFLIFVICKNYLSLQLDEVFQSNNVEVWPFKILKSAYSLQPAYFWSEIFFSFILYIDKERVPS